MDVGVPVFLRPLVVASLIGLCACSRLSGGGGVKGTGVPVLPPLDEAAAPTTPSLLSAAAGSGRARVTFTLADSARPLGLFAAADPDDLYDGPPVLDGLVGGSAVVEELVDGVELSVGLAFTDGAQPQPSGAVVRIRPGPPIYVDPSAPAAGADGTSPATAYPDLLLAMLDGLVAGGANIWLAGADFGGVSAPLYAGVHLAGGFAPGFVLEERDPVAHPTILRGVVDATILEAQAGVQPCSVDGLQLLGDGLAKRGLVGSGPPLEVRDTLVRECASAGLRLAGGTGDPVRYRLLGVASTGHGGEGLSLDGAVDLVARACRFDGNVQEGFDADDQLAPDAESVRIALYECRAAGNGSEGIDIDLIAPLGGGPNGARHDVLLSGCRVELNGTDGVLIDADSEAAAGWEVHIEVVGLTARANGRAGLHLDLDGEAHAVVRDSLCSANGEDGLLVTSDVQAASAVVTASAFLGNGGAGARASQGQAALLVSHAAFAANAGGGLVCELVSGSALSCVSWLQGDAFVGARVRASVEAMDALQPPLGNLPDAALTVTGLGDDGLQVQGAPEPPLAGDLLELGDDGVARTFLGLGPGGRWLLDPAPAPTLLPARLFVFPDAPDVVEDYRANPAGPADGAGLAPPGDPPLDAGPLGSDGDAWPGVHVPGAEAAFHPTQVSPAAGMGLAVDEELVVVFDGGVPAGATVSALSVQAFDAAGDEDGGTAVALDGTLRVTPPPAGWPTGVDLVLHTTLFDTDGQALVGPVLIPFGDAP